MKYRIIATDLDGTLLNSQMKLSPENKAAIEALAEAGVEVVVSTGRSFSEVSAELLALPQMRYHITSNGAAVLDKQSGEWIIQFGMEGKEKEVLFQILRKYRSAFTVHNKGSSYMKIDCTDREYCRTYRMSEQFIDHIFGTNKPIADFEAFCDEMDVVESCCCFFPTDEDLEGCRAELLAHGGFAVSASMPHNLELCSIRAGKGTALLALAKKWGIDPAATIGVGDGTNDMDNIQKAGLGLVVSNADPLLLPYADQIICSNDEHIMEYILKNIIK